MVGNVANFYHADNPDYFARTVLEKEVLRGDGITRRLVVRVCPQMEAGVACPQYDVGCGCLFVGWVLPLREGQS